MIYRHLILIYLIIFVGACDSLTYSHEGEPYTTIIPDEIVSTLDFNSSQDTLYAAGIVHFNYSIDLNGKNLTSIRVYVDSSLVEITTDLKSIFFNTRYYINGLHDISLEVWVNSESGSLANKFGQEYLVSTLSKKIWIRNDLFEVPFKILSIDEFEGALKLTWEKLPLLDFKVLFIIRAEIINGREYNQIRAASIYDSNVNSWIDSAYVGGSYIYRVQYVFGGHDVFSESKIYEDIPAQIKSVQAIDDTRIKISWNKTKYHASLNNYVLLRASEYNSDHNWYEEVISDLSINDSVFIDEPGFGNEVFYSIASVGSENFQSNSKPMSGYIGVKGGEYITDVQFTNGNNGLYINRWTKLDPNSFNIVYTGSKYFSISKSGRYGYTNNYIQDDYYPTHSFSIINTETLLSNSEVIFTDDILGYYSTNYNFRVTENGYCLYVGSIYLPNGGYSPPELVLLDPKEKQIITKDSTGYYFDHFDVSEFSDEGEYIAVNNSRLYNLNNKKFILLRELEGTIIGFSNSGKEYIYREGNNFSLINCKNNTLISSFEVEEQLRNITIDPKTGLLGARIENSSKYNIYNISTGIIEKELKLFNGDTDSWMTCHLVNSSLISSYGFFMKLND